MDKDEKERITNEELLGPSQFGSLGFRPKIRGPYKKDYGILGFLSWGSLSWAIPIPLEPE